MATINPSAAKLVNGSPSIAREQADGVPRGVFLDDDLVERTPPPELIVTTPHRGGEHQTLVEVPGRAGGGFVAAHEAVEGIDQLTRLDLGEITELSEVHAEQWDRRAVQSTDSAEHRAVAAEAHDDLGVGQRPLVGVVLQLELGAVVGHQPAVMAAGGQPRHRLLDEGNDVGPFVVGDDRNLRHRAFPVVA